MMKPFLTLRIFFSIMALTTAAFSASGGAGSESIEEEHASKVALAACCGEEHQGGVMDITHKIGFDGLIHRRAYNAAFSMVEVAKGLGSRTVEFQAHIHATVPTHLDELLAEAKIPQAKALFQAYFAFDHVKAEALRGRFEDGVFSALEQLAKAHVQATYLGIPQPTRDPTALAGSFEGALRREAMRSVQEATKAESARLEARTMPVRGGAAAWNVAEVALEAPAGGTAAGGVPVTSALASSHGAPSDGAASLQLADRVYQSPFDGLFYDAEGNTVPSELAYKKK